MLYLIRFRILTHNGILCQNKCKAQTYYILSTKFTEFSIEMQHLKIILKSISYSVGTIILSKFKSGEGPL